jgi:hypothetical protein
MSPIWFSSLLGIVAGIGVVLVVLNLRGRRRPLPERRLRLGRQSSRVGAEAERWLAQRRDRQDP